MNGLSSSQRAAVVGINERDIVELVRQLIRVPGVSGSEEDIVTLVRGRLEDHGWSEVQVVGGSNVVARLGIGPALLFVAYVDSPPAGAMRDPYSANVLDGAEFGKAGPVIRGRGACTKGTLAAMIVAAEAAWGSGALEGRAVVLAATSHDEVGLSEVIRMTSIAPARAVAGEPTGNAVGVAARGITWIEVAIRGRRTHAGMPELGVNPIDKLASVLPALRGIRLPSHAGLPSATLTPVAISYKGSPPWTADEVTLRFDRRTLPGETPEGVGAEFQTALAAVMTIDADLDAVVRVVDSMHPFIADPHWALTRDIVALGREITGREPALVAVPHGTNAGLTVEMGVPTVAFGPALIADLGDDEHVEIAAAVAAARILAALAAGS